MAIRECDCREFQDSGHTDECNQHYSMQKALALDEQKLIDMGAYDKPSTYDMSIHTNPDAQAWTKFFRECNPDCNVADDVMLGWFANSMMAMHDQLQGNPIHNGDHAEYLINQANRR